jgi:hypothetical protein
MFFQSFINISFPRVLDLIGIDFRNYLGHIISKV